ncbi:hypothetical protein MMC13_006418 [Lambiella insularis]|nr:hypothetical protein [Lambiella insularis]
MSPSRIAVVTGANKGVGLAIGTFPPSPTLHPLTPQVRNLALRYPNSAFNNGPLLIYLTARNKERGEAALAALHHDPQLHAAAALAQDGGLASIAYHPLDIAQTHSIRLFAEHLRSQHPQGIDVVVNNAGIALTGFDAHVVDETLQCNYYGTLEATQTLLPLLRPGGRLVNVSSMVGKLNKYSAAVRARFLAAGSVGEVTALMEAFKAAVRDGDETAQGWPSAAYAVSKAGVTAVTGVLARELRGRGSSVLVNSCCPGYVKTDMTRGGGVKSVDEGARTPVLLALGEIGGVTGKFWQDEKVIEW